MALFQRKRRYSKISYEKRLSLIDLIEKESLTISRAAKKLHIKLPTAKVILSNYRKKGKIFNKKIEEKENSPTQSPVKVEEQPPTPQPPQQLPHIPTAEQPPCLFYYIYYPNTTIIPF